MILPLLLSVLATLAAALMAYGVHPGWVHYGCGLGLIETSRLLQWPLIALSLVLCVALLGLVISGKRRAWWLIGLAPVLALFGHRFVTAPANRLAIVDEPTFVNISQAKYVGDDDMIVGIIFNEQPFAYPYSALFYSPVVVQTDREKRMLLIWNPYANGATAVQATRELKARELDIVSDPADSLLLYNGRTGQFIVGLTGRLRDGSRAAGTEEEIIPVVKESWRRWKGDHPDTKVMLAVDGKLGPTKVLPPRFGFAENVRVALVGTSLAGRADDITADPINATSGDVPVVVFRDKSTGRAVAFDRRVEKDLIPGFTRNHEPRRKGAFMIDSDTNTGWNAAGIAVDGADKQFRGHKLAAVDVQEDIAWNALRFWRKDVQLFTPTDGAGRK